MVDDPKWVHTTIHKHPKGKFVNFENFEEYLLPQERLCTPSSNNKTAVLSFPLDHLHYDAAREAWEGKKNLIFMGQDPSCFAPHEQRSSFKSLSIAFDDALHTVKVTGKPLEFGDRHFPAPTHLVIGRPPSDVTLTRRQILEKRDEQGIGHCIRHPRKCLNEKLKEEIDKGLTFPFKSPPKQINFASKATEAMKRYWPPDEYNGTGIPPIVEVYCLDCEFAGAMEQVFTMEFHPVDGSKMDVDDSNDKEDDDGDENRDADDDRLSRPADDDDDDDDEDDHGQMFKDHVKRTFVTYTATDEIKFRKQIQIKTGEGVDAYCSIPIPGLFVPPSSMGCGTYFTGGGLSWEPGAAQVDKASRATAEGPTKVGDGKAGKSISGMGYSLWPLDIGVYLWMDFGISTKADVTLPGFEATIAKGSVMEVDITGDRKGISKKFEPVIEMLEPDLSIHDTEMHYNIAIGPKVGFSLGLPMGKVALGFGAKFDILRIDNRLAEYNNVTSVCAQPKEKEEVFKRALGYTMDVKTGFYAYFNLAGFYIDSSWLGDKTGDGIGGLYWGVKNLIAKCVDCGQDSCLKKAVDEVLGVVKEGFDSLLGEGFEDVDGRKKAAVTRLKDSAHVRKESIDSLDSQIQGMDMPSGDPNISCYATPANSRQQYERRQWEPTSRNFLREFVDHKKPNLCKQ